MQNLHVLLPCTLDACRQMSDVSEHVYELSWFGDNTLYKLPLISLETILYAHCE